MKKHKYIFIVGGVMSGVGKGIAASSIGLILKSKGLRVNPIKVDPYLNVDAGTMNPTEHGEVFVLDSGLETDQDMGNYERFMDLNLSNDDYMTSGTIYYHIIQKERNLGYKGKCVDPLPYITEEIINRWERSAATHKSDISLIEIGGTIGDYQNVMFIEAARILKVKHPDDVMFIMVSYLPVPGSLGEMKTRPTQNAVRQLNSYGVQPDMIIARSKVALDEKRKEKIAFACSIRSSHVISAPDIQSVYDVPENFEKDDIGNIILETLHLKKRPSALEKFGWTNFVQHSKRAKKEVKIAVVGKYFDTGDFVLSDAYLSVIEAIKYSSYHLGAKPVLTWLNAKDFESDKLKVSVLSNFHGIIVPGGFGESGIEGKLKVIKYAREKKIPYFGLCYGMQLLVIEYARNVLGLSDANTAEINPQAKAVVIDIMEEQKKLLAEGKYGASMRLGAYKAILKPKTVARASYGQTEITERHRHRYEVNPKFVDELTDGGLIFSGTSPDGRLMEIAELPQKQHPFFLGTQFHPEFLARPTRPHPLFTAFIKSALAIAKSR